MRVWSKRSTGYVLTVVALIGAAFALQDVRPLGPVLYFAGWALTLPTGVLVYPALGVILLVAGLAPTDDWSLRLGTLGALIAFAAAAAVNALVVRFVIRTMTGNRRRGPDERTSFDASGVNDAPQRRPADGAGTQ